MSFEWPVALPAGSDQYGPSSSHEDLPEENPEDALPSPPHLRWRRGPLQPPHVQQNGADRKHVFKFLMVVSDVLLGTPGVTLDRFFPSQKNRELKLKNFGRLIEHNNVICFRRFTGSSVGPAIQIIWYVHSWL